ncbi:HAD-IA family hydrolase [Haloferax sp. MBLA0076]|uniref:HAD-IA family hydrolase n=1 Tax=Haloferax litoreum TaxID=2666140 RepID=A0A6A8GG49_9EURY|nr:HAD family hydrolase [Haloferax litoreum]KAB1193795.1 HAD family hydrolase [Haloferax sp. CBA1148]MRX22334.1 HAD-IA family hydrolase [Haloferax litoreum]
MTEYDAIVFDSDGVLVEPPAYETQLAATRDAFRDVGIETPSQQHLDDIVGGVTADRLYDICRTYDIDAESFWDARERRDEQSQFEAFKRGARDRYDDVAAIAELPGRRGVVSNNHHSTIEFKLDFFELEPLFDTFYGREMTIESLSLKKPNTHYLDNAEADLDATSALYVGDSESDVVAAHNAGVDSVFIRRPHCRETDLTATPTHEIDSLSDLTRLLA